MEPVPAKIDELLSGMLDGVLSEKELVELERAMQDDPSLQGRLDEMGTTRSALLRGRPRGRLGSGFAERVVAEANKRVQLGKDSSNWLAPSIPSRDKVGDRGTRPSVRMPQSIPQPIETVPAIKRAWVYGSVAIAASLALIFVSIRNKDRQGLISEVAVQIPSEESESKSELDAIVSARELLEGKIESIPVPSNSMQAEVKDSSSAIASNENSSPEPKDSVALPSLDVKPALDDSPKLAVAPESSAETRNSIPGTADINPDDYFLFFVDVTVSPRASERKVLNAILQAYGILQTDDLVLSDEDVRAMVASGMVARNAPNLTPATVLLLDGPSANLDRVLLEMLYDVDSFPEWSLNMKLDPEARKLANQLRGIPIADKSRPSARRLTLADLPEKMAPFAGAAPRSQKARQALKTLKEKPGQSLLSGNAKERSTILLVIREVE